MESYEVDVWGLGTHLEILRVWWKFYQDYKTKNLITSVLLLLLIASGWLYYDFTLTKNYIIRIYTSIISRITMEAICKSELISTCSKTS